MNNPKLLTYLGLGLITSALIALVLVIGFDRGISAGIAVFLAGFAVVSFMFYVNATSTNEKVKKERGRVVFTLCLFGAVIGTNLVQRMQGVDTSAFSSAYPYMIITIVAVAATFWAIRRRSMKR